MPHKHKRKDENNAEYVFVGSLNLEPNIKDSDKNSIISFNLPPTSLAKSLPVGKNAQTVFSDAGKKKSKTEKTVKPNDDYTFDDTPKAFARLMQRAPGSTSRLPSGLDNGEPRSKKRKRVDQNASDSKKAAKGAPPPPPPQQSKVKPVEIPTIMPGERLRDFNARVDAALPVSGLARKGNKGLGPKDRQTKKEKQMQKMYAEWRKEDVQIKEKAEEAEELREEEEEENKALYGEDTTLPTTGKHGKRKRMIGEDKDDKDDPWAELALKRDGPKGLHDVAQAPPEFTVKPKEKFKVKNNARVDVVDVPNAAGSLKRREELGAERQNIIEQYRALMSKRDRA